MACHRRFRKNFEELPSQTHMDAVVFFVNCNTAFDEKVYFKKLESLSWEVFLDRLLSTRFNKYQADDYVHGFERQTCQCGIWY